MVLSDYIAGLSLLVAFLSIGYTYSIQRKLNKKQLEEITNKEAASKQADFMVNFYESGKIWTISITNTGYSDAHNVQFESNDLEKCEKISLRIREGLFPIYLISPDQSVEIPVMLASGHKPSYLIKLTWNDDYQKNRQKELTLFV